MRSFPVLFATDAALSIPALAGEPRPAAGRGRQVQLLRPRPLRGPRRRAAGQGGRSRRPARDFEARAIAGLRFAGKEGVPGKADLREDPAFESLRGTRAFDLLDLAFPDDPFAAPR
jgi:hypothetical protein